MNRIFNKSIALIALVGAMTTFSANKAEAALSLVITTSSGSTLTVNDQVNDGFGGVPDDSNATLGAVVWTGSIGQWIVNTDTGIGVPVFPNQPHMDLQYSTVNSGGSIGDWVEIEFIQTLTAPGSPGLSTHLGATNNSTSTVASVLRNGATTGVLGPFSANGAFSANGVATNGVTAPYTLSQKVRVTLTANGGGNASGDFEVIPEPASLALVGLGLAGLAARRRRQA